MFASAVTSTYSIFWPSSQGAAGTVLTNDGSGNLTWTTPASAGVSTFNTLTGAIVLAAGTNISLAPAGNTITISSTGASSNVKVDIFTLSGTDITNKFVTLSGTPVTANETILLVRDAAGMFYGSDFSVTGAQLGWNGLALDGILASGDNLTVEYRT